MKICKRHLIESKQLKKIKQQLFSFLEKVNRDFII
jgi:hypothetical protein